MSDFLSSTFQWINAHPEWSGLATFLISAAESVAIIGTIVPGSVMMTALGALAGAGVMPLGPTIFWAILGAIVGDGISYWIGYYFKDHLHDIWPFRNNPYILERGENFFHKHGGKSVFIGRFVGPVRALVPLVAGMLNMKPWRFTIANILSAIGWAPAYMLPGIALGAASLELPPDIAVHAILMMLLVGLFIIFCVWTIQKVFWLIGNRINTSLTQLWMRLQTSRYFSSITKLLKHHNPRKTYGQLTLAFYFIVTSMVFFYFAAYIKLHGSQDIFINQFFYHFFRSLRTSLGESIMIAITLLAEPKFICWVSAILFLWLGWTKRWRIAFHVLILTLLTSIGAEFFKTWVHSSRPWGITHSPDSGSFPSGHTTFAVVFYLGMAILFIKALNNKYRKTLLTIAAIIIAAVGISRIYMGAHWVTDVLGGIILGAAALMLVILSFNRKAEDNIKPLGIFLSTLAAFLIGYTGCYFILAERLKQNYALTEWPTQTINWQSWWKHTDKNLPLYRRNRFGLTQQIFNVQWVGNLAEIKKLLLENGWQLPPETNWITVLHRISDVQSAEHLPLVWPLYFDKKPVLVLIKHQNGRKKLIVLRLWMSHVVFKETNQPLWLGVVEVAPRTYNWLFPHRLSNDIKNLDFKSLSPHLQNHYDIKQIQVTDPQQHLYDKQKMLLIKPKNI